MRDSTPTPEGATDAERGLKPCPFCGGEIAPICVPYHAQQHTVICANCSAHGPARRGGEERAIAAWNTRPAPIGDDITSAGEVERIATAMSPILFKRPDSAVGPATMIERNRLRGYAAKAIAALATPTSAGLAPVSDDVVRAASRAIHEHLCRRNIMQYLDNDEDCEGLARAALSSLTHPQPSAGEVLVPREPTEAMLDQGVAALESAEFVPPSKVWSAMIAAAPRQQGERP